jgi:hypothetical protein
MIIQDLQCKLFTKRILTDLVVRPNISNAMCAAKSSLQLVVWLFTLCKFTKLKSQSKIPIISISFITIPTLTALLTFTYTFRVPNALPGRDTLEYEIFGMEGIPHEDLVAHEQAMSSGENPAKRFKAGSTSEYSALTPEQIQQQIAAHKAGGAHPVATPPPAAGYYQHPPPGAGAPPMASAYPPQYSQYYQQQPQYPPRPPPQMGYRPPPYGLVNSWYNIQKREPVLNDKLFFRAPPPGYGAPPHQFTPPAGAYGSPAPGYPPTPNSAGMAASPISPARPPVSAGYDASSPPTAPHTGTAAVPPYAALYGSPAHTQAYDPNAAPVHGQAPAGYDNHAQHVPTPSVPAVPQTLAPGSKQKPTRIQLVYNDSEISPVSALSTSMYVN